MIVLPRQRLVFLHIHKNAGSSVRSFLRRLGEETHNRVWNGQTFKGHVNWRDMVAAAPELAEYDAFVISRNPWSRLVSAYEWWKSKPETSHGITSAQVGFLGSFTAFVDALDYTREEAGFDPVARKAWMVTEARSKVRLELNGVQYATQYSYVIASAGDVRATHLPIEALSDALPAFLSDRLGRPVAWHEINRNRNSAADWRSYYSDRDAETVGRLFAKDVRHFGYCFER